MSYSSWDHKRVRHNLATKQQQQQLPEKADGGSLSEAVHDTGARRDVAEFPQHDESRVYEFSSSYHLMSEETSRG